MQPYCCEQTQSCYMYLSVLFCPHGEDIIRIVACISTTTALRLSHRSNGSVLLRPPEPLLQPQTGSMKLHFRKMHFSKMHFSKMHFFEKCNCNRSRAPRTGDEGDAGDEARPARARLDRCAGRGDLCLVSLNLASCRTTC